MITLAITQKRKYRNYDFAKYFYGSHQERMLIQCRRCYIDIILKDYHEIYSRLGLLNFGLFRLL